MPSTMAAPRRRSPPSSHEPCSSRSPATSPSATFTPFHTPAGQLAPPCDCFSSLRLSPHYPLHAATRTICPTCNSSRRYWCAFCIRALVHPAPRVALPLYVELLQTHAEAPQKSTAQHVAVLAPAHARVWRPFPACEPAFARALLSTPHATTDTRNRGAVSDQTPALHERVAMLYPAENALSPAEAAEQFPNLERLVVIDASWSKSLQIAASPVLAGLPRISLSPKTGDAQRSSRFWRYAPTRGAQSKMFNEDAVKGLLSTVEAVHAFFVAYGEAKGHEDGVYDDLMWLFAFNYRRVKEVYVQDPGKRARIMRKSKGLLSEF